MSDLEILTATKNAFKAFDALKPGEGIDITESKTYKADKGIMLDICTTYIDNQRANGSDTHELNEKLTVIKRLNN